jgi:hypothetical protein
LEYSKSGRATCKGCKFKIDKDEIRIGIITEGPGDYEMCSWKHIHCFSLKRKYKDTKCDTIPGFDELSHKDRNEVREYFVKGGKDRKESEKKK